MKKPKFLSRWADEHGIPRRTAYDRFSKRQLGVKATRLPSGSIVVLEDDQDDDQTVHPFSAAYAAALGMAGRDATGDLHHSPLLEAWGRSLYETVAPDLRPLVLGLANSAAVSSQRQDSAMGFRLLDFVAHVDLPAWYRTAGLERAAEMLEGRGEINDRESFYRLWPTAIDSFELHKELIDAGHSFREAVTVNAPPAPRAVASLAIAPFDLELTEILPDRLVSGRNSRSRDSENVGLLEALQEAVDLKDESSVEPYLFEVRGCYGDALAGLGIELCRQAARASLRVAGWELEAAPPPISHQAHTTAFEAVVEAERTALAPHRLAALLREITAFHCIATGQPLERRR